MGKFNPSRTEVPSLTVAGRITQALTATDNDAQHNTLSAAEIKGGIVVHTSATGAGNVTTDTAANIISGIPLTANDQCVKCYYMNDGDQDLTFVGGTDVDIADDGQLCIAGAGNVLIFRRTSSTEVSMYSLGGDVGD